MVESEPISLEKEPPMVQATPTDPPPPPPPPPYQGELNTLPATTNDQATTNVAGSIKPFNEVLAEVKANGGNALMALLGAQEPKLDEEHQKRLQRMATYKGIGDVLALISQAVYGNKGADIPLTPKDELIPQAYSEYMNNIRDYENKKLAYNAQKMAAEMRNIDMANARMDKAEDRQFAVGQNELQYQRQKEQSDLEYQRQKELKQMDYQQREDEAKRQYDQQLELFDKNTKADLEKIRLQYGNQAALQAAQFKHQKQLQDEAIAGGKYQNRAGTGAIKRNVPNGNFVYYSKTYGDPKTGTVILNPNQDGIVEYVLSQVIQDKALYRKHRKILDKVADGTISESEARMIMNAYADNYITVQNGVAQIKGMTDQQENITGGAY